MFVATEATSSFSSGKFEMKIHALASFKHYIDHIAPIWRSLDPDLKGNFVVNNLAMSRYAECLGIYAEPMKQAGRLNFALKTQDPILVAGYTDLQKVHKRPIVFIEHGAGQTYIRSDGSIHGGYSGGVNRDKIGFYVCPNETVLQRNLNAYPDAQGIAVGSPRLDDLSLERKLAAPRNELNIGIAFHWDCNIAPEAGSAFSDFYYKIPEFVKYAQTCGMNIVGHGHPRAWSYLYGWWKDQKVRTESDWLKVSSEIDLLIIDNSSILFEAAALDIPVVLMESSKWRKNVHHGLRFWEYADIGPSVTKDDDLGEAISEAFHQKYAKRRKEASSAVYACPPMLDRMYQYPSTPDGLSSRRAAAEIIHWCQKGKH